MLIEVDRAGRDVIHFVVAAPPIRVGVRARVKVRVRVRVRVRPRLGAFVDPSLPLLRCGSGLGPGSSIPRARGLVGWVAGVSFVPIPGFAEAVLP